MIGDVVGLGKTMMATALARMFEDDLGYETLIICPKNLEPMWERYRTEYGLRGKVLPISQVTKKLPDLRRYRLVLIDESHNLRNREGRRYRAIADYIRSCDAKVILLTATPYNKTNTDLSSQLRLFIDEKANIGIRPERLHAQARHGRGGVRAPAPVPVNSILAIEKSDEFDDWRELMRLYMVRRTRSFIIEHYTEADERGRRYLPGTDGEKRYFPQREPRHCKFAIDEADPADQYARLYSGAVVDEINALHVPRYGLGNYVDLWPRKAPLPPNASSSRTWPRRQAADGFLPHQPLQAPGVIRFLVPAVDRSPHPAQPASICTPSRKGSTCPWVCSTPACWTPSASTKTPRASRATPKTCSTAWSRPWPRSRHAAGRAWHVPAPSTSSTPPTTSGDSSGCDPRSSNRSLAEHLAADTPDAGRTAEQLWRLGTRRATTSSSSCARCWRRRMRKTRSWCSPSSPTPRASSAREMQRAGVTHVGGGHRRHGRPLRAGLPLLAQVEQQEW